LLRFLAREARGATGSHLDVAENLPLTWYLGDTHENQIINRERAEFKSSEEIVTRLLGVRQILHAIPTLTFLMASNMLKMAQSISHSKLVGVAFRQHELEPQNQLGGRTDILVRPSRTGMSDLRHSF
jgi:hypothetical protein